ncbi:MAG: 2-oxoacid:acceptor oxidoreductase subunit alpha [Thermaerobacter sp.]|nr:2-oxoacid:acceptor oxidoreductase subunit alpha [Thermaerobacter sp.]
MAKSLAWKIGGDQGEGIDSTGDVVGTVASRLGYYIYGYKHFSSRIKGGHTHYTVRLSAQPVLAPEPQVHVLVALTQETIDRNVSGLVPGGPVLADAAFKPTLPPGAQAHLIEIPLTQIAREIGAPVVRNMVSVGASAALLGLPLDAFAGYVEEKFARKGAQTVSQNVQALEQGYRFIEEQSAGATRYALPKATPGKRYLMTGNDALALGALGAGCRLMAAYPITPATDIMETLAGLFPKYGGAICQMEDELAAITMVIGAGYAGARAMTATSGPGFSLMQEGIGLASVAEIPAVVVDTQRVGPSTGMPTKMEQSDLMAAVFGGHGEGERIVLTPGDANQAFVDGYEAFNLAERYQCPVIVLSDLGLAQWVQTVEHLPYEDVHIDRGAIVEAGETADLEGEFERYRITADGISPRTLPGTPKGQYLATGVEHGQAGKVSEDPINRTAQVQKRRRKLQPLRTRPDAILADGTVGAEVVVVCFGSTIGAVDEAVSELRAIGIKVGRVQVRQAWPLPVEPLRSALRDAHKVLFVEQNSTGELRELARLEGLEDERFASLLKYDGTLLLPQEVMAEVRTLVLKEEV